MVFGCAYFLEGNSQIIISTINNVKEHKKTVKTCMGKGDKSSVLKTLLQFHFVGNLKQIKEVTENIVLPFSYYRFLPLEQLTTKKKSSTLPACDCVQVIVTKITRKLNILQDFSSSILEEI